MKRYRVRAFGVAKEILGGKETLIEMEGQTVASLRQDLMRNYPELAGLRSLLIAVNNVYADDLQSLSETDEIAIIPPVSGG
jgi:sulfur-carrier protein